MAMDDTESCGSRSSPTHPRQQQRHRLDVYNEVLRRLRDGGCTEALAPVFEDELWAHFNRLPARYAIDVNVERAEDVLTHKRYAIDVNVERAEDVLTHKRLLQLARDPANRPVFNVRVVQVSHVRNPSQIDSFNRKRDGEEDVQSSSSYIRRQSIHPPPAFGSSANLEALALEASEPHSQDGDIAGNAISCLMRPMHEVTFSTVDKPKLLSQLTSLLADVDLNIQEAHAFSTNDGYSLDVFVVDGWPYEETEQLRDALQKEIQKIEETCLKPHSWSSMMENIQIKEEPLPVPTHVQIPTDGTDVWEIDLRLLKFENKVASGSYGDLYRGTYCSQDVAIKVLKPERINADMQREFAQEVYIMRKVRHKNVVQFIGACTRPPSLCIVTEFMSGGSVYDFLHKQKGVFKLPALLRVAIDVSKGMNYLHQNNIIHRDLKAANLLMDENEASDDCTWLCADYVLEVVKVADFGVARVKAQSGVMTAETGTYRWMAPEVIEHKPYDHKADVFSFAVVLWELLTGKLPYEYLTPLQAAVGVVQKGLRPTIPKHTHPKLSELLERCWQQDPALRPDFSELVEILQQIAKEVGDESEDRRKSSGGFLSVLRRGH